MVDRPKVGIVGAGERLSSVFALRITNDALESGAIGLVALKNLLEEGFDATAFERNDYVGGLWHFTEDTGKTSVTESEFSNNCICMLGNLIIEQLRNSIAVARW